MHIDIHEPEEMKFIKRISEEELFEQCGRDQRMFEDFIRHIKLHPYAKPLDEYWIYCED